MSEQFSIEHRKIEISLVPHNYTKRFAAPVSEAIKKGFAKLKTSEVWTEPYGGTHSEKDTMIVSLNKDIKIASVAFRKLNGKKNRGSTAFKDMASAISLQCSTN